MAGDRRATSGNLIAQRDLRKLEPADSHSCIAFAGAAGFGLQLVRVFQLELQHYEKLEGVALSFPGKVSRLSTMVRDRLAQAMQGFAAVPVFAGWDVTTARSHVVTFDVSGSPAEEPEYGGTGSGWFFAKGSLKKGYRPGIGRDEGVRLAVEALADAADEDTATGGPDPIRRLYPTVAVITADGYEEVPDEELAELSRQPTA
jgi:proteasome beta subunit